MAEPRELLQFQLNRMKRSVLNGERVPLSSPTREAALEGISTEQAQTRSTELSPIDHRFIEIFVRFFTILGMPRSVGEIYGLLYSSPHPLPFERITSRLGISMGSTSKGLRALRDMGAIRVVYKPGDRRDHYTAEIAVKMLVNGFLREKVEPHLAAGFRNIECLNEVYAETELPHRDFYRQRIDLLVDMHHQARKVLPTIFQSSE